VIGGITTIKAGRGRVREAKGVALAHHRFGFSGFSPPGFAIRLRQHSLAEPARRRCRKLSRPKPCQLSNIGNEFTHKTRRAFRPKGRFHGPLFGPRSGR
jgi:hypothetical protein